MHLIQFPRKPGDYENSIAIIIYTVMITSVSCNIYSRFKSQNSDSSMPSCT